MKRRLVIGGLLFASFAATLPFIVRAERFRTRIHSAIEQSLHRKVDIQGKVGFSLWPGPGFSFTDVVIHEDPAMGLEPFAYVPALDASIDLTAFLQGRWEVSSILLDEPNLNIYKQDSGSWNIRPLLAGTAPATSSAFPEIQVRSGRINLRFGDTKSTFYFINADIDIAPSSNSDLKVRFSMEPARTDRIAQGFGTLRGRGAFRWSPSQHPSMELDLEAERSTLADIVTLLGGPGAGMRGFLASRARITGPIDKLKIEGTARLEDIQRWDLLRSASGGSGLRYHGTLDFPAGELDLETLGDAASAPVRLRLRGHSLFSNPTWGALAQFNEFPVSALRDGLQFLDVSMPDRASLDGKLSGVLGYSPSHGFQGLLIMPLASVKIAAATLQLSGAQFSIDGERFRLLPSQLQMGDVTAEVEGAFSPSAHSFTWRTGNTFMPIASLLANHKQLLGGDIPFLGQVASGEWRGSLQFEKSGEEANHWNAQFELREAKLEIPGLASPVEIESATAAIVKDRLTLDSVHASAGGLDFTASYRRELAGPRPHRFRIFAEQVNLADLEKLFLPTLKRTGGFLRTLSFRATLPEWLRDRHLQADIRIGQLSAAETPIGSLQGRLQWDAGLVELTNAQWVLEDASAAGKFTLRLIRPEPEYKLEAAFLNLPWNGGAIDGDATFETSGTALALVRNARSSGHFTGRSLAFSENDVRSLSGTYELASARLKLTALEAVSGQDTFTGQGASETDGRLIVDLASGRKKMRIAGAVWPFQIEVR